MTPDLKRRLAWSLLSGGIGVGVVLLALQAVSSTVQGEAALSDLAARARWGWIALAWGTMAVAFLCMGMQWRSLMPVGSRGSAVGLTAMVLAGLMLNYAVPGPVGEVSAAWLAHRRYGVPLLDSVASGAAARVVGLATSALLALGVWAVADLPIPPEWTRWIGLSVGIIGLGGCLAAELALQPLTWQRIASRLLDALHRWPWLREPAIRAQRLVVTSTEALASVVKRGRGAYARTAGWAVLAHGLVTTVLVLAAAAFGLSPSPLSLLFAYTMSTAGGVALAAFPGSQLSRDALLVVMLVGTCGLGLADALAMAAVLRLVQLSQQALGGLSAALMLRVPSQKN